METATLPKHTTNDSVISKDIAEKEVNAWLDRLEVDKERRENSKTNFNIVVNAVMAGRLIIDAGTDEVTQKLKYPIGLDTKVTELKFKTDLRVGDVNTYKKGIDREADNIDLIAYVCASTTCLGSIIQQMNQRDFNVSTAIVLFFVT